MRIWKTAEAQLENIIQELDEGMRRPVYREIPGYPEGI